MKALSRMILVYMEPTCILTGSCYVGPRNNVADKIRVFIPKI